MFKKDPEGYKKILVYKKADELHTECLRLAEEIKKVEMALRGAKGERAINKILLELADQIGRAGRSPSSNIVEGWKRNTTKEYFDFLGFAAASAEEIHRDTEDIIKGKYKDLMGVRGIMGERPLPSLGEIAKLPFYPLDPFFPLVVKVKLRTKELTMLIYKLQQALEQKMSASGELPLRERLKGNKQQEREADEWLRREIERIKKKDTPKE